LPGRIPEDFPLPMPVPPHSRLLGTVAHSNNRLFVIMLECDLPLNEASSLYRTHFAALHWRERGKERVWPEQQPTDESVQSDVRPAVGLEFWHTASHDGLILHNWLTLMERENATTLVRMHVLRTKQLYVNAEPQQPEPPDVLGPPHRAVHLLPMLCAPTGAQLQDGESHVDPVEVEMTSEVTTPLDPSALAQHYTKQLRQAWNQTKAGGTGPFVWTVWQFTSTDPEPALWSALFLLLKMPDKPDHYTLEIHAIQFKPEASW